HTLASYDDAGVTGHRSAYVLEAGTYKLHVGNSVKNVKLATVEGGLGYEVESLRVVEQLEEVLAPIESFQRMKPGKQRADGTYELVYEDVPTRTVSLADRIEQRMPKTLEQTGNRGLTLRDVHEGKATMEAFIAQ